MSISLCITNYNRNAYLFKSFEQVYNDERISEIIISDDCSDLDLFIDIGRKIATMPKVKLSRNPINLGCFANKAKAVSLATNDYVIIFDSDNVLNTQYLDKVFAEVWNPKVILAPDFAEPVFDYRQFAGQTFNKTNVGASAYKKGFDCMINTMNYFAHRDSFLSVYQPKKDIKGADSIYMNYLWLMAGNEIKVVSGMKYYHRTDHIPSEKGSNYITYAKESEPKCAELLQRIASFR